ncbi:hypothetical protein PVAP13_8KG089615 [Panicum virgatum]|uniref:Secreted protein n=1 Tax=Panicum virgatum TaxID=38727 RepID=A0A8T0PP29_PANVG|nr:hypothetical protein PVAP13_8KG089615 [Panicum virgatum]
MWGQLLRQSLFLLRPLIFPCSGRFPWPPALLSGLAASSTTSLRPTPSSEATLASFASAVPSPSQEVAPGPGQTSFLSSLLRGRSDPRGSTAEPS